jgi:cytoskeletal protein CcmA (bactofilin family)
MVVLAAVKQESPMFENKKRPEPAQAIHTLLGKGTLWVGEVHAGKNSLRIEGTIEGTIHSQGEVTIAPTGHVKGLIHAQHLIVTGLVEGVFKIVECLEIHGTGRVEGEVEVGSLVVDEGGTLQGTITRRNIVKLPEGEAGAVLPNGHGTPLKGRKADPATIRIAAKPEAEPALAEAIVKH